jgi:Fe-S-cluster containining protein
MEEAMARAAATARTVAATLSAPCGAAACETASAATAAALMAELHHARQAGGGAAVACAAGCAYCCHQRVMVLPHEAVALLRYLRTALPADALASLEAGVLANAARVDALGADGHREANLGCALLVDGHCSAYGVRPSICAAYHSLSRARCEHAFAHPRASGTPANSRPVLRELQVFGVALRAAIAAGVEANGLSSAPGELHQTLRALIEDAGAAARWGAGGALEARPPAGRSATQDIAAASDGQDTPPEVRG